MRIRRASIYILLNICFLGCTLSILSYSTYAQSVDTTWTRLLDKKNISNVSDMSAALNQKNTSATADSSIIGISSSALFKFDQFGNIQWKTMVEHPHPDTFLVSRKVIADTQSSTYWVMGYQIVEVDSSEVIYQDYIARFDSSGTLLDTAIVDGSNRFISDGVLYDGKLYFTGGINFKDSVRKSDIWFGRYSKADGIEWDRKIDHDSIPFESGEHIQKTSDGFLIGGEFERSDTSTIYLAELNKSGDLLWEKEYQFDGHYSSSLYSIVGAGQTGYLLMGLTLDNLSDISTGYLMRMGSQGNLRWKKVIENVDTHPIPNRTIFDDGIYHAEDSTFIVGGSVKHYQSIYADQRHISNTGHDVYLLNVTSGGKHNWQYTMKQEGNQSLNTLLPVQSADSNKFIAGGTNQGKGYLIKINYADQTDTRMRRTAPIAKTFKLKHNYPNPFNPSTTIKYSLPEASKVKLNVYNLLGQKVTQLVNSKKQAGTYSVTFDAGPLSSGVYIYKLQTESFSKSRKMLLVK